MTSSIPCNLEEYRYRLHLLRRLINDGPQEGEDLTDRQHSVVDQWIRFGHATADYATGIVNLTAKGRATAESVLLREGTAQA